MRSNWAANYTYRAETLHMPSRLEELQDVVAAARRIKPVGTRHSFNGIADSEYAQVSLELLNRVVSFSEDSVTVEGGMTYGQLCRKLAEQGRAIHNLASLPHISVAGACATATHGSGVQNGNLATAVRALELVKADGSILQLKQGDPYFEGSVVNLGALGVVSKLTLATSPSFEISQRVFEGLLFRELLSNLEEILSCAYSVSLFTDWKGEQVNQVWIKDLECRERPSTFFGATAATSPLHPIGNLSPENCTAQLNEPGPWHDRLPHFRLDHTPSSGEELQSEYLLPRQFAREALTAIDEIKHRIAPLPQISEVRTIAADRLWMSPCYEQDCLAIHFTWKKDWPSVRALLPELESRLAPFQAKPHWGKLFVESPRHLYPRLKDFQTLRAKLDPNRKFDNTFLQENLYGNSLSRGVFQSC